MGKFTPSFGKPVQILDENGKPTKTVYMNRKERRRLKVKKVENDTRK